MPCCLGSTAAQCYAILYVHSFYSCRMRSYHSSGIPLRSFLWHCSAPQSAVLYKPCFFSCILSVYAPTTWAGCPHHARLAPCTVRVFPMLVLRWLREPQSPQPCRNDRNRLREFLCFLPQSGKNASGASKQKLGKQGSALRQYSPPTLQTNTRTVVSFFAVPC